MFSVDPVYAVSSEHDHARVTVRAHANANKLVSNFLSVICRPMRVNSVRLYLKLLLDTCLLFWHEFVPE